MQEYIKLRLMLKRMFFVGLVVYFFSTQLNAEDGLDWKNSVIANLNLSQASFQDWAPGGEDTFSWLMGIDGSFDHDQGEGAVWENMVKLRYGTSKVGDAETQKTDDEIKLDSMYVFPSDSNTKLFVGASLLTQFSKTYDFSTTPKVEVSNFMDPGYFMQRVGYQLLVNEFLKLRFGAAAKETVTKKHTSFSDGKKLLVQTGGEFAADYQLKLGETSTFKSKLEVFYDERGPDFIDYYWDNVLSSKINDLLSMQFNYKQVFDRDASELVQRKNSLSMGFSYVLL